MNQQLDTLKALMPVNSLLVCISSNKCQVDQMVDASNRLTKEGVLAEAVSYVKQLKAELGAVSKATMPIISDPFGILGTRIFFFKSSCP